MPSRLPPAVAFLTVGCPKNEVDTDLMRQEALRAGYRLSDHPDGADVIVVNTCAFIREATEESIETVFDAMSATQGGLPVIVAGCMPSRYGDELVNAMPEAAAFVPVTAEDAIADVLTSVTGYVPGPRTRSVPVRSVTRPSAYLRISDGCDRRCSYCTIPSIRGPHRSLTLPRIVAEARELVAHGALEIVLIGQDTTAWGRDLAGDETLADVVAALADLKGLRWLRIMYAQPDGITDELLDVIGSSDVVCNYLDMPLQHVDARILRAMRRGGGVDGYRGLIERIRAAVPDIVLRTTLISGFPGETSDQARELLRFVEDMGFDYVGVFPYSPEDGTQAATFESQVPLRTRRARAQRLRDAGDRVGAEKAASHVGRVVDVLVEAVDEEDGVVIGRWRGQAPDIDGVVVLDRGQPGSVVSARITDSFGYDLEGQVL